ncbi:sugar phosphate isomerase/epimerase family protein [Paenibacillus sp. TAF58]
MSIQTGINLFSIYDELDRDYFGTLDRVAATGYTNIELISFNMKTYKRFMDEIPAETLRDKLAQIGLTAVSAHELIMPGIQIDLHNWEPVWSYYDQLNCHSIVLPSVPVTDIEGTLRAAEHINQVGKRMREQGFTFYVHNHAHEFKKIGDQTLFDLIVQNTDPAYVHFELDLVWVLRAGLDPVEILGKLGSRCDIIHQKDISSTTAYPLNLLEAWEKDGVNDLDSYKIYQKYTSPEDHVDLGAGTFDFERTYAKIKEMGNVRYAFVENEGVPTDKMKSITSDFRFIQKYL